MKKLSVIFILTLLTAFYPVTKTQAKNNLHTFSSIPVDTAGWKTFDSGVIEITVDGVIKKYHYTFRCPEATVQKGRYDFIVGEELSKGYHNHEWKMVIMAEGERNAKATFVPSYTNMEKTGKIVAASPVVWQYNTDGIDGRNVLKAIWNSDISWSPSYYVFSTYYSEDGDAIADKKFKGITKEVLKSFRIIEVK